ncbi:MAG: hypothetical protein ABEL76_04780 [Bradymonadaceae bacterium]
MTRSALIEDRPAPSLDRIDPVDTPQTDRVRLNREAAGLELVRSWNRWFGVVSTVGALGSAAAGWYMFVHPSPSGEPALPYLLALGTLAIYLAYLAVCFFWNRTEVRVDPAEREPVQITVEHGPLPWPSADSSLAYRLRELTAERESGAYGAESIRFRGVAHLPGPTEAELLAGIKSEADAEAIARAVEQYLGIGVDASDEGSGVSW